MLHTLESSHQRSTELAFPQTWGSANSRIFRVSFYHLQELPNRLHQGWRIGTHDFLLYFAILPNQKRRHRGDTVFLCDVRRLVHVNLSTHPTPTSEQPTGCISSFNSITYLEENDVLKLFGRGQLRIHRRDALAGATPRRGEIQHDDFAVAFVRVEQLLQRLGLCEHLHTALRSTANRRDRLYVIMCKHREQTAQRRQGVFTYRASSGSSWLVASIEPMTISSSLTHQPKPSRKTHRQHTASPPPTPTTTTSTKTTSSVCLCSSLAVQ